MLFSGDFCHFPIDCDVVDETRSDLVPGSFCTSLSSIESRNSSGFPVCPHSHNFECLHDIVEDARPHNHFDAKQGDLCDVTFLVGASLLPVYGLKPVMAARSTVLEGLFERHSLLARSATKSSRQKTIGCFTKMFGKSKKNNNSKMKQRLVISLPEHDPVLFDAFLTYIHTGRVNIDVNNLAGLLHLSEVYKVNDLRKACWDVVDQSLTSQNVIPLLTAAQRHAHCPSVAKLINVLLQHIDRHAISVLSTKTFKRATFSVAAMILSRAQLAVSPNDRVAAILSWAKRYHRTNTVSLTETVNRLLKTVDFSRVTSRRIQRQAIEFGYRPPVSTTAAAVGQRRPVRRELFPTSRRLRKHSPMRSRQLKPSINSTPVSESGFSSM